MASDVGRKSQKLRRKYQCVSLTAMVICADDGGGGGDDDRHHGLKAVYGFGPVFCQ